jgi:hypothetical protein
VSNVLLDAVKDRVRSNSPRTRGFRDTTVSRERQSSDRTASPRGRTTEPKKESEHQQKKSSFGKFGDILKLDSEDKEAGWKEFKKGPCLR